MSEMFEVAMVLCFGISWPLSIYKSYTSRTTKGKSLVFECFIWIGYIFGIVGKLLRGNVNYVLIFYFVNLAAVTVDICLYFRNRRLDRLAEKNQA